MSDPQVIIDKLFIKLDQAKNNGEIQQATHALRVQITNKKSAGLKLTPRERDILGAVGPIKAPPAESGGPLRVLITFIILAVIAGVIYSYAWPYVKGMMH